MAKLSTYTELWTALAVRQITNKGGCSYAFLKNNMKTWQLGKVLHDYYLKEGYTVEEIALRMEVEQKRLLRTDLMFEVEYMLERRVLKTSAAAFDRQVVEECRRTGVWNKVLPEFAGAGGLCISTFLDGAVFKARIGRSELKVEGIKQEISNTKADLLHVANTARKMKEAARQKAAERQATAAAATALIKKSPEKTTRPIWAGGKRFIPAQVSNLPH